MSESARRASEAADAGAITVEPASRPLRGVVRVPGDKSISHRAAILAALATGESVVRGFSHAGDCASTLGALRALGAGIEEGDGGLRIAGGGLREPGADLDCGRSGTTMRLLAGALASSGFRSTLTGDPQLLRRPMERVAEPLRRMGARIETSEGRPPLVVDGASLAGIRYVLPVASAQVKAAVLLAGLDAGGETAVVEPVPTRDHTERLLAWLGAPLQRREAPEGEEIAIRRFSVPAFRLDVPGDPSSAAPLLAAAAMVPGSDLTVEGVGLNPTRTGFLRALASMGADVEIVQTEEHPEPVGSLRIRHAPLRGIAIGASEVPGVVDELPLLGVVATAAEGTTEVRGAEELRVKETDRVAGLVTGLRALGAGAQELPDGFVIGGGTRLPGGSCDALGDHRLSMAFAVAGLAAESAVRVTGPDRVDDSFPGFWTTLGSLA